MCVRAPARDARSRKYNGNGGEFVPKQPRQIQTAANEEVPMRWKRLQSLWLFETQAQFTPN